MIPGALFACPASPCERFSRIAEVSDNARRNLAAAAARRAGVDALLVTHLPDVRWLCGFTGSNAAVLLPSSPGHKPVLFTDGRYTQQARSEANAVRIVIGKNSAFLAASKWLGTAGFKTCGYDDGNTTVTSLKQMQSAVPPNLRRSIFRPVGSLVSTLRWVKDAGEIRRIRAAALLGCHMFERVLRSIEPGKTELDVALKLELHAKRS